MDVLNLNSLSETLPEWSENQCNYFSEGLSVGLEIQGKSSGVEMKVSGIKSLDLKLEWKVCGEDEHRSWKEPKKIAEMGATAMAFFLTEKLTDYIPTEEAAIGTGVDYWLGYKENHTNYDELNFLNARLEISGINKEEGSNTIEKRVEIKKKQVKKTDGMNIPVFISVSEFGEPKSVFIKK